MNFYFKKIYTSIFVLIITLCVNFVLHSYYYSTFMKKNKIKLGFIEPGSLISLLMHLSIIGLISYLLKKNIVDPLKNLDRELIKISKSDGMIKRVSTPEKDPYLKIRTTLNTIIDSKEKALHQTKSIISILPDMIFIYDKDGYFIKNLSHVEDRLLKKKSTYLGHHLSEILPFDITEKTIAAIDKALLTGNVQEMEYSLSTHDKTEHYESRLQKLNDQHVIAVVRNITERANALEHVERLSYRDQLTGLYNRHFFNEELARHDNKRMLPLSLALIDVNGLKLTNDAFGHLAGDELLKKVAHTLLDECRSTEVIARIGGDEFIILLPNTENADVGKLIKRINTRLQQEVVKNLPVSVSIGWETKTSMDEDIQSIFVKAENKMYKMKLTESQSMRNQVIKSIMTSLKSKSELERDHSENVSKIAVKIGSALNFQTEQLSELKTVGLLHDIGKIAMDDAIINKIGPLTNNEYEEIKRHSEIGYQILKLVNNYSGLAEYVLYHHEHWDGSGYPHGIKGENIPLISRIISIADAYEAMTSKRPFREEFSHAEALERIRNGAGTLYDPTLVSLFIKII